MRATRSEDAERWPTDIVEAREAEMLARLSRAETTLAPLRAEVGDARHPWWGVVSGIAVAGGAATFALSRVQPALAIAAGVVTLVGLIWSGRKAATFQKAFQARRDALDAAIRHDVLGVEVEPLDPDALEPWADLRAWGRWEDARVVRLRVDGRDMIHAHLTRTETTTDGKGNTTTRTVTVFDGLLFVLPFPDDYGDAVTVLRRGQALRPTGAFLPPDAHGRALALKPIKTSSLAFNRTHRVLTTDPVMGHAVLDPDRTMRLIQMEHDLSDALRWRDAEYAMLIAHGRAHMVVGGVGRPDLDGFPEGEALGKRLRKTYHPLSIPTVMAHHLRLTAP